MSASCIRSVKRYLCVKKLTVHDGFKSKTIKLPRAEARFFMGDLRNRQAMPLVLLDEGGSCWELLCICTGGQYALSRIGAFCEAHGVKPGSYFIFYADHDHIVRLAVRDELPEDVLAAVAAARAALAARNTPQKTSTSPPQQQPPASPHPQPGTASDVPLVAPCLPASTPCQPVIDDPAALDEMPLSSPPAPPHPDTTRQHDIASTTATFKPAPAPAATPDCTASEPARAKPLQDRSNLLLANAVMCESGKPKKPPSGPAAKPSATPPRCGGCSGADKENESRAVLSATQESPPRLPGGGNCPPPFTSSSGGLSPPSEDAASRTQSTPPTPQPTALRPPSPLPPARSPAPPQLVPSPATRLRLRYEARLRAQAGKLHPLSVRTGPNSPPPVHPSGGGFISSLWSPTGAGGPYPGVPGLEANMRTPLLPFPWGWRAGGTPPAGYSPDCSRPEGPGPGGAPCPQPPPFTSTPPPRGQRSAASSYGALHGSNGGFVTTVDHAAPSAVVVGGGAGLLSGPGGGYRSDSWQQQLQCEEDLLEWDVARRCEEPMGPLEPEPAVAWTPHDAVPQPPAAPSGGGGLLPDWLVRQSAAAQTANLVLLRQLLMRRKDQALAGGGLVGAAGEPVSGGRGALSEKPPQQPLGAVTSPQGLLLSLAATQSTLRQLLGINNPQPPPAAGSAAGGGWPPLAAAPGHLQGPPGGPPARGGLCGSDDGAAAGVPLNHWQRNAPSSRHVDCENSPPGAGGALLGATEQRQPLGCGASKLNANMSPGAPGGPPPPQSPSSGGVKGPPLLENTRGARSGPLLSRGASGPPTDSPSSKRPRCDLPLRSAAANNTPSGVRALPLCGAIAVAVSPPLPSAAGCGSLRLSRRPLSSKALTAHDLLSDRVAVSVAATACSRAVSRLHGNCQRGADGGGLETKHPLTADGAAAEGGGTEPMDVDTCHPGTALSTGACAANRPVGLSPPGLSAAASSSAPLPPPCHPQEVPVEVVVESGARYEGALLLGPPAGSSPCGPTRECALQGLRPYLIRRQAGVGDVLVLWLEEGGGAAGGGLRLHAQLQLLKGTA